LFSVNRRTPRPSATSAGTSKSAMKHLAPVFVVLALLILLCVSGCESYDGGGSGFTQRDLELQRKQQERQFGR
jgi:hypothetical protein